MRFEYFIVLAVCLAGPAVLSFSKKIRFYSSPIRLITAIAVPFIVFVIWDFWATARGHWGFNQNFITGIKLFNLPIEEVLFFIVIPFCGLFLWETVKYYSESRK